VDGYLHEAGLALPPAMTLFRIATRLLCAAILGAIVGWERETSGRAAGLRTHIMVALGAALFTVAPMEAGATASDLAQLVKGIAAGIGFLGAGAILKLAAEREIQGLTTAASIWLTAAVGLAVGAGQVWLALFAIVLSLATLVVLRRWERPTK
jgi:putative Mg2+ transporter-C (MgtC) family protein